jgi:lysophospholipase L1-like esterase
VRGPLKGLLISLLVLPWALLVVGLGAEGYVRWKDRQAGRDASFFLPPADPYREFVQPHPFIGYEYRPGAVKRGNLEEGGQNFRINAHGMRGFEMSTEKPPGTYRILCLGGSTTFGTGATEDEFTYPARLEHYLNAMAPEGRRYEVGNCGTSGYTTAENLINLELRLVELDPDAILIYAAANDARPIQARGFRPDYSHYRRSWVETELTPADLWLLEHVRLYAWLTRGLDPERQFRAQAHRTFVPDFKELHVPSAQGVPEEGLAVFFRNLGHIVAIAREHDIQPVLSTFATCAERWSPGEEDFRATVAAIDARLPAFAAERDLPVLDIAAALDDRCELFDDWMHLNDEGSDAHGRAAADEARRLGLFGL